MYRTNMIVVTTTCFICIYPVYKEVLRNEYYNNAIHMHKVMLKDYFHGVIIYHLCSKA